MGRAWGRAVNDNPDIELVGGVDVVEGRAHEALEALAVPATSAASAHATTTADPPK